MNNQNSNLANTDVQQLEGATILERACLLHVTTNKIGMTKQVTKEITSKGELINADTDTALVKATKRLFNPSCEKVAGKKQRTTLEKIVNLDDEVKAFINRKCMPSPIQRSVYLIPLAMVETVDAQLLEFKARRDVLIEQFVAEFPNLLIQASLRLRELFDEDDYPHPNRVAEYFNFQWGYVALGVPDALGEISVEIFEREREKAAATWAEHQEQIQTLLRVRLKGMIEHLQDRLKPTADGKKKIFRDTLIGNITEFMNDFHALNITNDAQLEAEVERVRSLLSNVDAQTLRDSENARNLVIKGAAQIQASLTDMIIDRPSRRFKLDEEDED